MEAEFWEGKIVDGFCEEALVACVDCFYVPEIFCLEVLEHRVFEVGELDVIYFLLIFHTFIPTFSTTKVHYSDAPPHFLLLALPCPALPVAFPLLAIHFLMQCPDEPQPHHAKIPLLEHPPVDRVDGGPFPVVAERNPHIFFMFELGVQGLLVTLTVQGRELAVEGLELERCFCGIGNEKFVGFGVVEHVICMGGF